MGPHQSESTSLLCLCAPCPPTPAASPTVSESMSLSPCVRSLQQPYTLPPGHNASGKSCFLLWLLHQSQADILWPLEGPDHTEISCYCNARMEKNYYCLQKSCQPGPYITASVAQITPFKCPESALKVLHPF